MQYRKLGNSGIKVSVLSLGSWLTFGKQISDDTAEALMIQAYEQGVNFFDNAEIYARGKSEIVMGNILKKLQWDRSSYLVSSKAFFGRGDQRPNMTGLSRKHLTEACHEALRRLQTDYLDLFFCHRPDPETPIEETVRTMNTLIQQGKILYWGTSEWSAKEIQTAWEIAEKHHLIGPLMEQPQYNMFHRERFEEEYAPLYKKYGTGTTIWSPLASGVLTGKYNSGMPQETTRLNMEGLDWLRESSLSEERVAKAVKLEKIANIAGLSLTQLALLWCLHNENVSTVILGASKITHLQENLKTIDLQKNYTADVHKEVETVLNNKAV
ncbi:MAG: aldo/keto reductase [Chitinophagales bacterium]|nr:aldo/keto reductase [Bacteroidota bacterium]